MDQNLQALMHQIQHSEGLNKEEKNNVSKVVRELSAQLAKKNRDLEIEAALEKVRARTMAIRRSDELPETASEMFKQVQGLGVHLVACGFSIFEKDEKVTKQWMSSADGGMI